MKEGEFGRADGRHARRHLGENRGSGNSLARPPAECPRVHPGDVIVGMADIRVKSGKCEWPWGKWRVVAGLPSAMSLIIPTDTEWSDVPRPPGTGTPSSKMMTAGHAGDDRSVRR